jgi:hypothetical protein
VIRLTVRLFSLCLVAVALVLVSAPRAAAQGDTPKVEVAVGYNETHDTGTSYRTIGVRQNFPKGWFASIGGNLNSRFGVVGLVSGNQRKKGRDGFPSPHIYLFLVGPKVERPHGKVNLFAQVLFGGAKSNHGGLGVADGKTAFAFQPGGGADLKLGTNCALRAGISESMVRAGGKLNQGTNLFAGIVFRK